MKSAIATKITGEIKVLVGPRDSVMQAAMKEGIRQGQGLMAEFLKGGLGHRLDKAIAMGEFQIIRPALSGEIDPVKGFSVEEKTAVQALWKSVEQQVEEGKCNFLVLDGIGEAISSGLIPRSAVLDLILQKPARVDVILTGSTMPQSIKTLANEIRKIGEGS